MATEEAGDEPNDFVSIFRRHQEQVELGRNRERKVLSDAKEKEKRPYESKNAELVHEKFTLEGRIRAIVDQIIRNDAQAREIEKAYEAKLAELQKVWESEDEQRRAVWQATMNAAEANAAGEDASETAKRVDGTAAGEAARSGAVDERPAGEAMDIDVPLRSKSYHLDAPGHNKDDANQDLNGGPGFGASQPTTATAVEMPAEDSEDTPTGGFTAVNASVSRKPSKSASDVGHGEANGALMEKPPRRSLPDGKLSAAGKETPLAKRFAKSPSGSEAGTPRADESDVGVCHGEAEGPPLPEITRSTLALQHNGEVYTAPEIMVGVPVRKINENDPYWDPKWTPLVPRMEDSLATWQSKYEAHTQAATSQNEVKRSKHAQFLANRQVNRGRAILEFLGARGSPERVGEINPYQLVAKQFINAAYINYDTIYRLVATLGELKKFSLDVTPIEWVRQRLHEIQTENPLSFQLSKVVADLYHDPKLQALRSKNGFGNIGRPSGTGGKKPRTSSGFAPSPSFAFTTGDAPGSAPKASRAEKRKEPHETPRGTSAKTTLTSLPVLMPMPAPTPTPMPMHMPTRMHMPVPAPAPAPAPLAVAGHTDPGFLRMALNPIDPPQPLVAPPLQPDTRMGDTPSEAVQSYREAIRRTQAVVEDFQRRAEQNKPPVDLPPPSPVSVVANKKARLQDSVPLPPQKPEPATTELPTTVLRMNQDDTHHDGYTSVDSYSGDLVMPLDWRVSVVKTAERSSGAEITQYWHWVDAAQVDDGSEGNFFEHQVLSEVKPPDWGVYKDPINFHLRLSELAAVIFAPGSLRIVVSTVPVAGIEYRGDVLAEFKRERTKRRLLKFMKKKNVKLIKTNATWINNAWERVNPVILPGDDSDE